MGKQGIELFFDAPRDLVELAQCPGSEQKIETDREQALLAALQTFTETLGVFERDLPLGVGDALATQGCQTR